MKNPSFEQFVLRTLDYLLEWHKPTDRALDAIYEKLCNDIRFRFMCTAMEDLKKESHRDWEAKKDKWETVIKDIQEMLAGFVNEAHRREEKWVWRSDIQDTINYIHETCYGAKSVKDIWDLI